jgi:CheY-like chemotaxis protein
VAKFGWKAFRTLARLEDYEVTVDAMKLANMQNLIVRIPNEEDAGRFLRREGQFEGMQRPSLILLDLNLAGADGRKLLSTFRQTEWLCSVPICVLTTSSNPKDVELCYRAGGNVYLTKPVNSERFEAMIRNLVTFWFDTAVLPRGKEKEWDAKLLH